MEAIDNIDLIAYYSTSWPVKLDQYKSVFLNLGIINSGHILTAEESGRLVDYLDNGGRLYLEGRRTWYNNPQLPIHEKFNIDVVVDTWFEYDTITGEPGTFTDGMEFEFNGGFPYNDYWMVPEGNAFPIFSCPEPEHVNTIAYDEGTYKTIGCAFEFGGLENGASPSTREKLMLEYLTFFGDIVTAIPDVDHSSEAALGNIYPNPSSDQITINFNIEKNTRVTLEIFNISGSRIATLVDADLKAGKHDVQWNGEDVAGNTTGPGVYLCTLRTNSVNTTKKIIRY